MYRLSVARVVPVLWLSLIILWNNSSSAFDFDSKRLFGKFSSGAFLGRYQPMVGYQLAPKHELAFGVGGTPAIGERIIYQLNLEYRFQTFGPLPVLKQAWSGNVVWNPLQLYFSISYAWNSEFFLFAPDRYPYNSYYEQTTIAYFPGAGSEIEFSLFDRKTSFYWWVNVNDRYLIAKMNNRDWHSEYCCSSGIGFKMHLGVNDANPSDASVTPKSE